MKPFNEVDTQKTELAIGERGFHGDVIIERVDDIPGFDAMTPVTDGCVAYGEATGHAHKLFGDFDLREDDKGDRYFVTGNVITLKHQEHRPVELPAGKYKIGIQREYDHFSKMVRRVVD